MSMNSTIGFAQQSIFDFLRSAAVPAADSADSYTPEMLQQFFRTEVATYDIENKESKVKLKLREEPLQNWQNTERQQEQGSIFVWLDGSRPAVVASLFTYVYKEQVFRRHEVISLSSKSLVASLGGQPVWTPDPADLKGTVVAQDSEPAATEPRRLTQMRSIARNLSGKHHSPDTGASELRLLPQPLIRYKSPELGILDAALFSFAVGTDPEILVMIEARIDEKGKQWVVVPFRSHYDALDMNYQGEPLWNAVAIPKLMFTNAMEMPYASKPFFVFNPFTKLPAAESLK